MPREQKVSTQPQKFPNLRSYWPASEQHTCLAPQDACPRLLPSLGNVKLEKGLPSPSQSLFTTQAPLFSGHGVIQPLGKSDLQATPVMASHRLCVQAAIPACVAWTLLGKTHLP